MDFDPKKEIVIQIDTSPNVINAFNRNLQGNMTLSLEQVALDIQGSMDYQNALYKQQPGVISLALMQYRNIPIITGFKRSFAELLFDRKLKTKLPTIERQRQEIKG
ncbi:hypothetical protein ILUMI_13568 [Ignelater luminosus]|uniref:Uncharacterized protein n=1 Tax=Ignelater luminosus TaxID=2038154 RepID=A0A8K0GAS7_IGNLU|nr:hypothetical protein ILUMI_13568 [Ignelater luminosus]